MAVIGASTSAFGAVWAQAELRKVLGAALARVLARELPIAFADSAFDGTGTLRDPAQRVDLAGILAELATEAQPRVAEPLALAA